jgi:hypothetical protein
MDRARTNRRRMPTDGWAGQETYYLSELSTRLIVPFCHKVDGAWSILNARIQMPHRNCIYSFIEGITSFCIQLRQRREIHAISYLRVLKLRGITLCK